MSSRGRSLRRAAYVVVGLPALLAILVVARVVWRPIALDSLRPALERGLGAGDGSFTVRLGSVELAWDRAERAPRLRARDVRILGRSGDAIASVQAVVVRLTLGALLRGVVAPAEVELLEPRLAIARDAGGRLDLGIASQGNAREQHLDVGTLAAWMAGAVPGGTTTASLRAISARGAELTISDRGSGRTWRLTSADLRLQPDAGGLVGTLAGRLLVDDRAVPVRSVIRYRPARGRGTAAVRFRGFDPGSVAPAGLQVPLDGTVIVGVDSSFQPIDARGHLRGGPGRLVLPDMAAEPIEVGSVRCKGRLDARARRLHVERLTMALGPSRIHLLGTVDLDDGGRAGIDAQASGEELRLAALGRWWPAKLAVPLRRWVAEHVRDGVIRTADLALRGAIGDANGDTVRPVAGTIAFEDVTARLDDRFPPVTNLAGTVRLDRGEWTARAERGRIGTIELRRASATLPIDGDPQPRVQMTMALAGPLAEALAVLDREPFGYARALGIVPSEVSGTMTAELAASLPRAPSRPGARTTVSGSARLTAVGVPRVLRGASLSDGEIALALEDRRLRASGTARLAGAPVSFVWDEPTTAPAGAARSVSVTGKLDSASRAALGFDLTPWLEGPVDGEAKLVAAADGSGSLELRTRLDDATIDPGVPRLMKPAGVPGRADARLTLVGNAVTRVERFTFEAGPSTITGTATLDGARWASARLQATVAGAAPGARAGRCTLTVQPEEDGHRLRLSSEDAGALVDAIAGDDRVEGGRLVLEGTARMPNGSLVLAGTMDGRSIVVRKSPILARIATLGSLSGIRSALAGGGVPFEHVGATLHYREPTLSIRDGLASGPALAFAIEGTIDRRAATADLRGTAIPEYYGLNTAPGRIPVLGEIIGGGRAQAVQAIDFTVSGALADPRVSVEPVSALAPGLLRDLLRKLRR